MITSESKSFTISLIVSFLINTFCEVFSELTLSPGFSMLLGGAQNISQLLGPHSYCSQAWYEKGKEIRCV
jgi:hypothetical protein